MTTCGNTGGCGAVGYQGVVARQWYHPYGSVRASTGALPTDITFTGQRSDATGLYFYNARYYSAVLGRFVQADTLVPGAGNPQSLNRYAYVFNNPLKYVDPSGHIASGEYDVAMEIIRALWDQFGITIEVDFGWRPVTHPAPGEPGQIWNSGNWNLSDLQAVFIAVKDFASAAGGNEAARQALGGVTIRRIKEGATHQLWNVISLADYTFNQSGFRKTLGPRIAIVHELAHYWDWRTGTFGSRLLNLPGAIVRGLPDAVGDEEGPTRYARTAGPVEDWAESVAGYVYPDYFSILRLEKNPLEGKVGLRPAHHQYVAAQFAALNVSPNNDAP